MQRKSESVPAEAESLREAVQRAAGLPPEVAVRYGRRIALHLHGGRWEAAQATLAAALREAQLAPPGSPAQAILLAEVLPPRSATVWETHGLLRLGDALDWSTAGLLSLRNIGPYEVAILDDVLAAHGLHRGEAPADPKPDRPAPSAATG